MTDKKITPEDATKLLEEDRNERARLASEEVEAILKKHRCALITVLEIAPGGQFAVSYKITAL